MSTDILDTETFLVIFEHCDEASLANFHLLQLLNTYRDLMRGCVMTIDLMVYIVYW